MVNYNIDPEDAVQALLELFAASGADEIEVRPDSPQEEQIAYIVNLPEAEGVIGYDFERHVIFLIKGET